MYNLRVIINLIFLCCGELTFPFANVYAQTTDTNSATTPAENPNPDRSKEYNWKERHEQVKARNAQGGVNLVFLGDSITHYFGGEPEAKIVRGGDVWKKYYSHRQAVNMGFGWDQTQHVLWRLENGELDGIAPKVAVVMIGVNNLMRNYSPEQTAEGIRAIVDLVGKKLPQTKIMLLGIMPFGTPVSGKVKATNVLISKFQDGRQIHFLDVGNRFLKSNGSIEMGVMPDGLHPNDKGYQIMAEAINPKLTELLGEESVK
ncbi:MAG: GDSL-type esterase/lipase family protein [Phycisphaerae bacterium]|jgi:lysophospholipase L1-like esterase